MTSIKHLISKTASKGCVSLLLLGAALMSLQSAQAQSSWSLFPETNSPTTTQSVTFDVNSPPGVSEPPSQSVPYTVSGPAPQSSIVASGNVTVTMGTAGCCAEGIFAVGPFATPGTYTAAIFPNVSCTAGCSATFTVVQAPVPTYPNTLSGQYTFYITGQEQIPLGGSGLEAIAGSFTADGQGHITAGELDKNSGSGLVHLSTLIGVYNINATTGKGAVTLQLPTGPLSMVFYAQNSQQLPGISYSTVDATIAAAGGSLLGGSGRLANQTSIGYNSADTDTFTFSLSGETQAGGVVSGVTSLSFQNDSTQVTGQAELIENGAASLYSDITGTATVPDQAGRVAVALSGLGNGAAKFALYGGGSSTVFLSLDPLSSAPLLVGTNRTSLPSYAIQYTGVESF